MTAPFVPSTDLSAAIPALVQKEQEPVAHTIPAVPGEPRPVAPAEEIGVPPAKALDAVASEKGLLEKAREATMPYIQKIQETTKPYVDAAEHKAEELIQRIEGTGPHATSTPTTKEPTLESAPYAAGPGTGYASEHVGQQTSTTGELGGKAKHFFEQGLATVSGAFNQITHTIEEKTKTDTHPGLVTQAQNAFQTGVHKVETFLDDKPTTTNATPAHGPILTTTNTVPHIEGDSSVAKPL